jgi:predicted enzyme related to lactoylglutathione lyase
MYKEVIIMLSNKAVVTTLPAVDLQRARKFYEEKLGLGSPISSTDSDVTYEAGQGSKIYLYKRAQTKADHTSFSFVVDDIEKEIKELKEKGVEFEKFDMPGAEMVDNIISQNGVKTAWFKDSEGNILALTEGM